MYKALARTMGLGNNAKAAYARRPEHMKLVYEEIARVETLLSQLPNLLQLETVIDDSILSSALGYVFQYQVEPGDAMHLVTALRNNVSTFATTDRMWANVPDILIYTPYQDLAKP